MRHPLHPLLVHFPVACWSLATIADLAGLYYGGWVWQMGGVLMAIGAVTAFAAMVAGLFELIRIPEDGPAMRVAYWHMGLMALALTLYLISLLLRIDSQHLVAPDAAAIVLSVCGFLCLLIGGWLGGQLVYGYGIGGAAAPATPTEARDADGSRR